MNWEDLRKAALVPSEWTTLATGALDPAQLRIWANMLISHRQEHPAFSARAAHLLLNAGATDAACELLKGDSYRLCKAQRLLCQVQQGKEIKNMSLLSKIIATPENFGRWTCELDIEAQMRLDYAIALAYWELHKRQEASMYFARAIHVARGIGVDLEQVVSYMCATRNADVLQETETVVAYVMQAIKAGNLKLAEHLAKENCETLLDGSRLEELHMYSEEWSDALPCASCWCDAAAILTEPNTEPLPAGLDIHDPLVLLATAYQLTNLASRAYEQLDTKQARALADEVAVLPTWAAPHLPVAQVVYRCLQIIAYTIGGHTQAAQLAIRDMMTTRGHQHGEVAALWVAVTTLQVHALRLPLTHGWTVTKCINVAQEAVAEMSHGLSRAVLTRLAYVAPDAVCFLARAGVEVGTLMEVTQRHILYVEPSVNVKGYPRASLSTIRDVALGLPVADSSVRTTRFRHGKALKDAGKPAAFSWTVEHLAQQIHPTQTG